MYLTFLEYWYLIFFIKKRHFLNEINWFQINKNCDFGNRLMEREIKEEKNKDLFPDFPSFNFLEGKWLNGVNFCGNCSLEDSFPLFYFYCSYLEIRLFYFFKKIVFGKNIGLGLWGKNWVFKRARFEANLRVAFIL